MSYSMPITLHQPSNEGGKCCKQQTARNALPQSVASPNIPVINTTSFVSGNVKQTMFSMANSNQYSSIPSSGFQDQSVVMRPVEGVTANVPTVNVHPTPHANAPVGIANIPSPSPVPVHNLVRQQCIPGSNDEHFAWRSVESKK